MLTGHHPSLFCGVQRPVLYRCAMPFLCWRAPLAPPFLALCLPLVSGACYPRTKLPPMPSPTPSQFFCWLPCAYLRRAWPPVVAALSSKTSLFVVMRHAWLCGARAPPVALCSCVCPLDCWAVLALPSLTSLPCLAHALH
ncbi:hypothetical protein TRVL_04706 [Trypanosoma vivax]|nr:hypothetical protein TRVL_04706 [Trypanosoma vivax]